MQVALGRHFPLRYMTNGPLQPYLSPSGFSTKTTGATVVPYAVRLPRNPTIDDRNYPVGSIWVNTATESLFGLGGIVSGEARWAPLGDHPLGDLRTLTGNSGGAVSGTIFNIDIVGSSTSGITVAGNPATSTLTLNSASGFYEATLTTTDATPSNIIAFPVPASTAVIFEGRLVGYATSGDGAASALVKASGYRFGDGNIQVIGALDVILDKTGVIGPTSTAAVSQAPNLPVNLAIEVTGVAGVTINWKLQGRLTTVGI